MRMSAYYFSFAPTGCEVVDKILSAVATAGKMYHHTENWSEPDDETGVSLVDQIQVAAQNAADEFQRASGQGRVAQLLRRRPRRHMTDHSRDRGED